MGGFIEHNLAQYCSKKCNVIGIYRKQKSKLKNIKLIKLVLGKENLKTFLNTYMFQFF